jgi:Domain of unknown function (DUF4375)
MPCKGGYRETIDEAKRRAREEREEMRTDPFRKLWLSLVERENSPAGGFEMLSEAEKLYYAVGLLELEVYNGGFHQYFFNSSGSSYSYAEKGLISLGAIQTVELLRQAKEVLFPSMAVPVDTGARRRLIPLDADSDEPAPDWTHRLDELDRRFWADSENLGTRLKAFAREHELVSSSQGTDC